MVRVPHGSVHVLERSRKMVCTGITRMAKAAELPSHEVECLLKQVPAPSRKRKRRDCPDGAGDGAGDEQLVPADVEPAPPIQKKQHTRKESDQPYLHQLIKVCQFALSLGPDRPRQKICRSKYPDILRSNVLSKWLSRYFKYALHRMPDAVACKYKCVPNWWIEMQNLKVAKRGRCTVAGLPLPVAEAVDKAQSQAAMGLTSATKRADPAQGRRNLTETAKQAMLEYEKSLEHLTDEIDSSNRAAWDEFKASFTEGVKLSDVATAVRKLKSGIKQRPKQLRKKWKPNHMTGKRLNRAFGNFQCRTNTSGNFLAWDDPRMHASRCHHARTMQDQEIDPRLVLQLAWYIWALSSVCHLGVSILMIFS